MRPNVWIVALLVALGPWSTSAVSADKPHHLTVKPDDLKWSDVGALPGVKIAVIEGPLNEKVPFMFRLKIPANYKIPAHWHPSTEHVTVLSGTFHIGFGDKLDPGKGQALSAGAVAIMQPKTPHYVWTNEETIVQVHGIGPWQVVWVNPADAPKAKSQ